MPFQNCILLYTHAWQCILTYALWHLGGIHTLWIYTHMHATHIYIYIYFVHGKLKLIYLWISQKYSTKIYHWANDSQVQAVRVITEIPDSGEIRIKDEISEWSKQQCVIKETKHQDLEWGRTDQTEAWSESVMISKKVADQRMSSQTGDLGYLSQLSSLRHQHHHHSCCCSQSKSSVYFNKSTVYLNKSAKEICSFSLFEQICRKPQILFLVTSCTTDIW